MVGSCDLAELADFADLAISLWIQTLEHFELSDNEHADCNVKACLLYDKALCSNRMLFVVYAVESVTLRIKNFRNLYVRRGLFVVQIYTALHRNAHTDDGHCILTHVAK
jgi:hypothetical protein